jgi:hypothetical protein
VTAQLGFWGFHHALQGSYRCDFRCRRGCRRARGVRSSSVRRSDRRNDRIWATPGNGAVAAIVVTGAIGDYGTATTIDKNGKVDENGDYVKVALKKGGFEVNSVVLNQKTNAAPPIMVNNTTCSVEFGGSGPVTLFNGNGMYAGITGTLHITETFAGVSGRYTSGAKKGQCNMSNNSQPVAFWGSITGTGKIEFM